MKPRALDLFCGAGGTSMGLHRAGFEVYGIDIAKQPNYPFWFRRADALDFDLSGFAFIWAPPPCQPFSSLTREQDRHKSPDLIAAVRDGLEKSGALYAIENVPRAPIRPDVILQGDMFGLGVVRRRHFETNFPVLAPGALTSGRGLVQRGLAETVAGGGDAGCVERWSEAMGIDWTMTRREIVNAIPPDYAECIGRWAMRAIDDRRRDVGPSDSLATDRARVSDWPSEHPETAAARLSLGQAPSRGRWASFAQVLLGQAVPRS